MKKNEERCDETESFKTIVGDEAVARFAFQLNEVIALVLITQALAYAVAYPFGSGQGIVSSG